jgi:glycosyltransferase involved in cell wall biosynthesis
MKPWPVLLMVRSLGPGGTERQVVEFAKHLDRTQFEPHVGYFDAGFRLAELEAAGVGLLKMTMRGLLTPDSPRSVFALRRYVKRHGIRLAHTFDHPMNAFGVPAARLSRVRVVLASQRSHRDLMPPKYRPLIRLSDRLSDGIVVNSEALRRHLLADYRVPDQKIRVCYNTLDTEHFFPQPRTPGGLVVGVVCVLRAIKNVSTLINAFAALGPRFPNLRLLIVGDGPEREPLEKCAAGLGIAPAVSFRPLTSDVLPWLREIDIFVLPSLSEGFSNSLLEAMATGCCCVASRAGGNPELVRDEETGLLFEPGNTPDLAAQIIRLVENDSLRRSLAVTGARWAADNFSPARSVTRLEQVYREFIEREETH